MNARTETKQFADFRVADLALADWGRKEIRIAETEMPGLMAIRDEYAPHAAAARRAHRRQPAHDDPDRGADRDAAGARRRRALGVVQHLLDAGPCGGRDRGARARRCSRTRASRSTTTGRYTHRIFEWPAIGERTEHDPRRRRRRDAARASRRAGGDRSVVHRAPDQRGGNLAVRFDQGEARADPDVLLALQGRDPRRDRGDDDRRQAPVPDASRGQARRSRRSTSTIRSRSRSSTTCTAAASRWSTASSARPT